MTPPRDPQAGIVLINVLVVLAIAAGVAVLMLDAQDSGLDRSRRAADRTQAQALALSGEASVAVALRRDMHEAAAADHLAEPWAQALQQPVALPNGSFSVAVQDVNARYDIGRLAARRVVDIQVFLRLAAAAGLPADVANRVVADLVRGGARAGPDPLAGLGLNEAQRAALAPHVTHLPGPQDGQVNLNSAGALVLTALTGDADKAALLLARRQRAGFLTAGDFTDLGLSVPPASGFTSDLWDVTSVAQVGAATARLSSRLHRWRGAGGAGVAVLTRDPLAGASNGRPPAGLGDPPGPAEK